MRPFIKSVTFDCADALTLARFWAEALGAELDDESTSEKAFLVTPGWAGPKIWFQRVPEPKTAKNRMHFDLRAPGGDVPAEVERLLTLGATLITPGGISVLEDPEGNVFCVEG